MRRARELQRFRVVGVRSRLLQAGYVEDPTVDEDLQQVLRQRDYLIQRQAGLIKKNGAMVDGFIEELSNMCGIEQGAAATVSTYDAALVREASVVRGQIEPTLAVGADVVRGLREETAAAVARLLTDGHALTKVDRTWAAVTEDIIISSMTGKVAMTGCPASGMSARDAETDTMTPLTGPSHWEETKRKRRNCFPAAIPVSILISTRTFLLKQLGTIALITLTRLKTVIWERL